MMDRVKVIVASALARTAPRIGACTKPVIAFDEPLSCQLADDRARGPCYCQGAFVLGDVCMIRFGPSRSARSGRAWEVRHAPKDPVNRVRQCGEATASLVPRPENSDANG